MNPQYDYTNAGFDGFMSRSIDNMPGANLDSPQPRSKAMRFDKARVSGMLGDKLQIGKIRLENTRIVINDGDNDRVLLGEDVS